MVGNLLYYGDNLVVLRESIKDKSVDLIYLDPPFNSQANYTCCSRLRPASSPMPQIEPLKTRGIEAKRLRLPTIRVSKRGKDRTKDVYRLL